MIRLLIVDDETMITDSLFEIIKCMEENELDVYKAYSGTEALEVLNQTRIDIVLSDIVMPGINGLELLEKIKLKWPKCKVVFLTGHNEFNYIYKAIQNSSAGYILKTEGYKKVVDMVRELVAEINESMHINKLINKAETQMNMLSSLLQKEYLIGLLFGQNSTTDIKEQFEKLNMPLHAEIPYLILLGNIDNLPDNISYTDRMQLLFSVKCIADQFFKDFVVFMHVVDSISNMIWLIQPSNSKKQSSENEPEAVLWNRTSLYIKGTLELIQSACRKTIGKTVSFVMISKPSSWEEMDQKYTLLKKMLNYKIGEGKERLLIDVQMDESKIIQEKQLSYQQACEILNKLEILESYMERGQKELFMQLFSKLTQCFYHVKSIKYPLAVEIYYKISLKILSHINRWNLYEQLAFKIGMNLLTRLDDHGNWKNAVDYLFRLSNIIFSIQKENQENRSLEAIKIVQEHIDTHLNGDLSLTVLSDMVHLNPSYLSRLFKQSTGENLSNYIFSRKIYRAKQFLKQKNVKVYDVAEKVGYTSSTNFTRFFKKITGLTPQEYHDSMQGKGMNDK